MVVCGDEVVVVTLCNATATNDVAAMDGVVVVVGAMVAVVVWVQRLAYADRVGGKTQPQ